MRSGSRKKNIVPFPRCSRRPRKSPTPSSTLREGGPASAARLFVHRERHLSFGNFGDPGSRRIHRPSAFWRDLARSFAQKYRPANPFAEPRDVISRGALAGSVGAPRSIVAARSRARSAAVFSAGNSGSGRLELSLLSGDPTNERSDRHHPAIHRAGLGVALHRRSWGAKTVTAKKRRRGFGGSGMRPGGRFCGRGALPPRSDWSNRRAAGCFFF